VFKMVKTETIRHSMNRKMVSAQRLLDSLQ
jgi:hypothetical protein